MEWGPRLLVWPEIETKNNVNTSLSANSVSSWPIMFQLNLRLQHALPIEPLGLCPPVISCQKMRNWTNICYQPWFNRFYEISAQDKMKLRGNCHCKTSAFIEQVAGEPLPKTTNNRRVGGTKIVPVLHIPPPPPQPPPLSFKLCTIL